MNGGSLGYLSYLALCFNLHSRVCFQWFDSNVSSVDKKCPFTGLVSIRGRILTGTVVSAKMHRTLVIRREYLHFIPKYNRYEKRHKNLAAHVSPAFRVEEGDQVTVGQCRPLSKTVRVIFTNEMRETSRGSSPKILVASDIANFGWKKLGNSPSMTYSGYLLTVNFYLGPIQRSPCSPQNR
jgi:ribosomal protein uS17